MSKLRILRKDHREFRVGPNFLIGVLRRSRRGPVEVEADWNDTATAENSQHCQETWTECPPEPPGDLALLAG